MTSILIDTNVLLDLLEQRAKWFAWSERRVGGAIEVGGSVILNPVVFAEASTPYETAEEFEVALARLPFEREGVPWPAAFAAAKAHLAYRQRGGAKMNTLPDFFIAAHALVKKYTLVTRDAARFRLYFPELSIIAPDTHP